MLRHGSTKKRREKNVWRAIFQRCAVRSWALRMRFWSTLCMKMGVSGSIWRIWCTRLRTVCLRLLVSRPRQCQYLHRHLHHCLLVWQRQHYQRQQQLAFRINFHRGYRTSMREHWVIYMGRLCRSDLALCIHQLMGLWLNCSIQVLIWHEPCYAYSDYLASSSKDILRSIMI